MKINKWHCLGAATLVVLTGIGTRVGERIVDATFQGVGLATEPGPILGREFSFQAPSDFPYKLNLSQVTTGTNVEIVPKGD